MSDAAARAVGLPWVSEAVESVPPDRLTQLADEILQRCRGEGPANCVARCPLHVDARGYVHLTKEGRYQDALQRVRERLPFPGILGYVCTHPCELHCKQIDEDRAIRIRDIKRFLAEREQGAPQHILDCEPSRDVDIAVVGAGPSGLIAAHDLRRKGYRVKLLERDTRIGGCLVQKLPPWRLPPAVRERDLSIIEALGIRVEAGVELGRDVGLAELRREYSAVLLLTGFSGGQQLLRDFEPLRRSVRDTVWADPVTCETGIPRVFSGADAVTGPGTVIDSLALGRRAAESAHRVLTGQDLRGNREDPLPARLFWRLDVDEEERKRRERTPVMLRPYNEALREHEALEEAERCLDCECDLCVKDCEFLAKHCASPKDLARKVKQGLEQDDVLEMVYSCNVCSLCATVCPEDLGTGAMLVEARRQAVERGKGPLPVHKPIVDSFNAGVSRTFRLVMSEPGRVRSKRLFFPGCSLPAMAPRHTRRIYDELRRHYPSTGVLMYCCGVPASLLGMEREVVAAREHMLRMVEEVGAEELITACPDCTHLLKEQVPDLKIRTVWEMLAGRWQPPQRQEGTVVSVHDSCKTRHERGLQKAVRSLLESGGARIEDVEYQGELTRCCGFGGMILPVDGELAHKIARRRGQESPRPMVTYCATCRIALAGSGKESIHILDFLLSSDWRRAARKKTPGRLLRYFNLLRTKRAFKRLRPLDSS